MARKVYTAPIIILGLTLIAILWQIGTHPDFAYNWENYTLWKGFSFWKNPSTSAFDLTDGLMTDSGRSWWIDFPSWLSFRLFGTHLWSLRLVTGIAAASASPFTWLLARRFAAATVNAPAGEEDEQRRRYRVAFWAATIAALLLTALPSFLLYARTATLVGMSVGPALLTVLLIDQVRRLDRFWILWLVALQGSLFFDAWGYAPIRFLYPLSLIFFAVELCFQRRNWKRLAVVIAVTLLALPAFLGFVDSEPGWQPIHAVKQYYNARGEQLLAMRDNPQEFGDYIRSGAEDDASTDQLARALVEQNIKDLFHLFVDRGTTSALTDYWNEHGRMIPWFVTPFVVLGMVLSLLRVFRSPEVRLLHLMFWGFTLPMIATSKVHIGRLVFAIPYLCIFAGIGVAWLALNAVRFLPDRTKVLTRMNVVAPVFGLALLVPTALGGWHDYHVPVAQSNEHLFANLLSANVAQYSEAGGVVWLYPENQVEVESISLAAVRIEVNSEYQFVNLALGEQADPNDSRPVVYFGNAISQLNNQSIAPELCRLPWVLSPDVTSVDSVPKLCTSDDISSLIK